MPKNVNSRTHMKQKARYYEKHRSQAKNSKQRWLIKDNIAVLNHSVSDVELSHLIGRSVMAIQIKRSILKKRFMKLKNISY